MADDKKYFRLRKPGESLDPVPPSKTFKLYMKDIDDPDAVDDNQEIVFPLKKPGDGVPLFLEIIQDVAACESASYYFLYGHNPDRIYPGGFVILYVYGGVPPFSWTANTPGYSFSEVSTDVRWNTLTADPTTGIGDVQVTIEDFCGTQVSGKIENQGVTATMVDSLIDAMQGAVDESFLAAELASRLDLLELNDGRLNVFDGWRSITVDPALTDYGQRISDAEIAVSANEAQIALSVIDINTIQDALNTPTTGITALVAAAQIDIASNADDIDTLDASIENRVAIAIVSDPTIVGIDTRLGEAETTLSTWFDPATGSIYAAYNVKLNADGVISGFGLMSYGPNLEVGDPGHSEFVILADQFLVSLPGVTGGDPVAAFQVGTVDGVPSIVAKQAIFGDATITSASIVDLDAEKINAGTINVALEIIAPYLADAEFGPKFILDMVTANTLKLYGPEGAVDNLISSLTQLGGVATATSTAHGLSTGAIITIGGANESDYNGIFAITVTGVNTFTYEVDSGATSPATGTIEWGPARYSELSDGDLKFFLGTGEEYKSVRRVIAGEASGGDTITISPEFYTIPKVAVFPRQLLSYDGTYDGDDHLWKIYADNVAVDGFDIIAQLVITAGANDFQSYNTNVLISPTIKNSPLPLNNCNQIRVGVQGRKVLIIGDEHPDRENYYKRFTVKKSSTGAFGGEETVLTSTWDVYGTGTEYRTFDLGPGDDWHIRISSADGPYQGGGGLVFGSDKDEAVLKSIEWSGDQIIDSTLDVSYVIVEGSDV